MAKNAKSLPIKNEPAPSEILSDDDDDEQPYVINWDFLRLILKFKSFNVEALWETNEYSLKNLNLTHPSRLEFEKYKKLSGFSIIQIINKI